MSSRLERLLESMQAHERALQSTSVTTTYGPPVEAPALPPEPPPERTPVELMEEIEAAMASMRKRSAVFRAFKSRVARDEMVRCPACGAMGIRRGLLGGACTACGRTPRDCAMEGEPVRKRVNPRVNRDLPEQVIEDKHPPADVRTEDLHQAVNSTGWHTIAAENLRKRCRAIERKLAIDRNLQSEARLRLQHRYEAYEQILDDPMAFFGTDGSDEA